MWARFFIGEYRPASLTENIFDRVVDLFGMVFRSWPTVVDIRDRCNIPAGKARYIVANLRYERTARFRSQLRNALKSRLESPVESIEIHE